MKKFTKIFAALSAVAGIFSSCQEKEPVITEFSTEFKNAEIIYVGSENEVAGFNVVVNGAPEDAKYDNVEFTLYSEDVDIQEFKIMDGSYEFGSSHELMTADAGTAHIAVLGQSIRVTSGTVTVSLGKVSGDLTLENGHTLQFKTTSRYTLKSKNPLPDFAAEVKNNDFMNLEILIRPANRSKDYFFTVLPADRLSGDDESKLAEIHGFYQSIISMGMTEKGNKTVTNEDTGALSPSTEYSLYVYGVENSRPSTALYTFNFTTSEQNDPTEVSFTSNVGNITKSGASVSVSPSDNTVLYVWDVVRKSVFDTYGKVEGDFLSKWLTNQIDGSFWKTVEDVVAGCGVRGAQNYDYTSLASGTEYVVFAVCVDRQGNAVSKAYVSEVFKTDEAKVSDVYVYQDVVAYYDGDALHAADATKYGDKYVGKYYVHMEVVVDYGTPVNTYAGITKNNPNDYSDSELISALVKSGNKNMTDIWYLVDKGTGPNNAGNIWAITVADDAEGTFGAVDKYQYYFYQNSCKPIDDIIK